MQLTLHMTRPIPPHGASRLVHAMSAWSAKTRRVQPRRCENVKVYGLKPMAMHEISTLPLPDRYLIPFAFNPQFPGNHPHLEQITI